MVNKYFKGVYKNSGIHPNPEYKNRINKLCYQKGIQDSTGGKGFYKGYYYYIQYGKLQFSEKNIPTPNFELVDFKYFLDWLEDNVEHQYTNRTNYCSFGLYEIY